MRLQKEQIDLLKTKLSEISPKAKVYLFGSRVDDSKKGGDIDLLIVCDKFSKKDIRSIRLEFFKQFGEQKLDIVLDKGDFSTPFVKHIFKKAVLL